MDELRSRRDHINAVTNRMLWNPPDETGCDITYLRVPQSSLMEGHQEGIQEYYSHASYPDRSTPICNCRVNPLQM